MADPKNPKDLKDLNQQAPSENQVPSENAELNDEDLKKISGGTGGAPPMQVPVIVRPGHPRP
jgi:bacteriocin-like protein